MPPGQQLYSLRYRSRGLQVQAYLDVPKGKGPFPLLIYLHGGDVTQVLGHWTGLPVYTAKLAAESSNADSIVFIPNYGGYGPSEGNIGSPYDCYLDTQNGLKALGYVRGLHIKRDATYPFGFSLGGYVALKLAANDTQVRAAVLDSPWPGALTYDDWVQKMGTDALGSDDLFFWAEQERVFGTDLRSAVYQQNSVNFRVIHVPVLIIGGQQDPKLPPSLMQLLRDQLALSHVSVVLDMVSGGHAPITLHVYQLVQAWLLPLGFHLYLTS